jgi:hypothetical protein
MKKPLTTFCRKWLIFNVGMTRFELATPSTPLDIYCIFPRRFIEYNYYKVLLMSILIIFCNFG